MPTTTYNDIAGLKLRDIGSRTDSAGTPLANDLSDAEDRLSHRPFSGGILGHRPGLANNAFSVSERGAGANMSADVGFNGDTAVLEPAGGFQSFQSPYIVGTTGLDNLPLAAADPANPRIDQVYLVIRDNAWDASGIATARYGIREGDPAASPVAPGPDGSWDAYLLLASIDVGAAASSIVDADITDERVSSGLRLPPSEDVWADVVQENLVRAQAFFTTTSYTALLGTVILLPTGWKSATVFVEAEVTLKGAVGGEVYSIRLTRTAGTLDSKASVIVDTAHATGPRLTSIGFQITANETISLDGLLSASGLVEGWATIQYRLYRGS